MNPKDRVAAKKVDLSLVPPASIIHEARAMANGAEKYGPFNWRQEDSGVNARVYVAAGLRHLLSWLDGEEYSNDTNPPVHHLAHAKACCGILLDAMEVGCLNDDRPPKGVASKMLEVVPAGLLEVEPCRDQTCIHCSGMFTVSEYAAHFRGSRCGKLRREILLSETPLPACSSENDAIAEALDAKAGANVPWAPRDTFWCEACGVSVEKPANHLVTFHGGQFKALPIMARRHQ